MTTLLRCLLVVEFSDLVFAVDSIPAALAVTPNAFIAITSNIFAILGLRALYFLTRTSRNQKGCGIVFLNSIVSY
ncbi:MAG: hypothetical protein QME74_08300, partial [Candidatus Edwardsbacteria bacterium]|nr:hypothetical protein [Candidatus Edwardsbacteria bacterium]